MRKGAIVVQSEGVAEVALLLSVLFINNYSIKKKKRLMMAIGFLGYVYSPK